MKTRQKLALFLTLLACSISLALFALVALGHYISQPAMAERSHLSKLDPPKHNEAFLLYPAPVPSSTTNNDTAESHDNDKTEETVRHPGVHRDKVDQFRRFDERKNRHH